MARQYLDSHVTPAINRLRHLSVQTSESVCRNSGILSSAQSSGFVAACRQHRSVGSCSEGIRFRVVYSSSPTAFRSCPTAPLKFGQADATALWDWGGVGSEQDGSLN